MKFGKYLQQQLLPEWSVHYINYKGLKKIIKKAEQTNDTADSQAFFYNLDRELEKVNAFYLEKETELKARLRLLQDKKQIMTSKQIKASEALLNLQEAFMQFQHELIKLQSFVEMNATGFRKILKKFDRRTKATTKEMYLASHVEVQPCFNKEILAELADHASNQLSDLDNILRESSNYRITFQQWIQNADHLELDLMKSLQNDDIEQCKDLLNKIKGLQKDQNDRDWIQRALRKACSTGASKCIRHLLENETDGKIIDDVSGRSCLHIASMKGQLEAVTLLTEIGNADLNLEDMHGRRPLHYAAMGGFDHIVLYLLTKKAIDLAIDQDGSIPLVYAVTKGHSKCVEAFLEKGSESRNFETGKDPLALAAENGHAEIVEMLIKKGYDPNKLTLSGTAPLHLSCREGHAKCCSLLTQNGADVMLTDKYNQWTPIFYAASEGHIECVKILLASGKCQLDIEDEAGWTPWQHALYTGHIEAAELLKLSNSSSRKESPRNSDPTDNKPSASSLENDMDLIPSLELPPPMIPCKIYGHHYLDRKTQVQIKLGNPRLGKKKRPLILYDTRQSVSLKLNISAQPNGGIPHTVILPLEDDQEVFTFDTDSLQSFTLHFDILPTFGSKVIGRAVALSSDFCDSHGVVSVSVLDRFELVGEIWFEYVVIHPFSHPLMSIAGKIQTYWKSTSPLSPAKNEIVGVVNKKDKGPISMITASSLAKEYIMLTVQVTQDGIPVVYDKSSIDSLPFDLTVSDLTLNQFLQLSPPSWFQEIRAQKGSLFNEQAEKKKVLRTGTPSLIHEIHVSLQDVFQFVYPTVGICLDVTYSREGSRRAFQKTQFEANDYVEIILKCMYDHAGIRSMILTSTSPIICQMLNLKQPNYPVFFRTYAGLKKFADVRSNSIDQGVRFAKSANLLGIVCEATPLVQVPALITTIKSGGLVLATFGNANAVPANIVQQEKLGVDAVVYEGLIRVKTHVEWF